MPRRDPKSKSLPFPTSAETDILSVLWRIGPATVHEVHAELGKEIGYTTTLKQMQVMREKDLLTRSERFKSHLYEPAVAKESTQRQIAADLLRRVFDGSATSLLLAALSATPPAVDELTRIQKVLKEFSKKRGDK
jgi:predicted transcriptional regulator